MSLREFLTALATDASQLAAFQANPDKAMQESGLSTEEQELVKSQNEERIKQYLQQGDSDSEKTFTFIIVMPPLTSSEEK